MSVNTAHEIAHSFFELGFGNEAIDHAELEGALPRNRLSGENQFESDFGSDKKRQNGRGQRRKNADADFRLSKPRFGSSDDQITEGGQLRAAADGRAVDDADDGFANFQHARERSVKSVEHLKDALRGILADVNAAAENFAGGIKNNQFDVAAFACVIDSVGDFAEHRFVEEIVFRAVEGHPRDAVFNAVLHELKLFRFAPLGPGYQLFGVNGLDHARAPAPCGAIGSKRFSVA